MARQRRPLRLPPPFLKRVSLVPERVTDWDAYPFCIPLFRDRSFEFAFERPITIIVGENGTGKSTLLEAFAALANFDEAGGGSGYRLVDHSKAIDTSGTALAPMLRASWLPRMTSGWFFKAETFFSVARSLDEAALEPMSGPPPDFLSHSHGEGFLRFFEERCRRQGVYIFDEPESALSPSRQMEFMKLMRRMEESNLCQVVIATHSPMLMAYPGAQLLEITKYGVEPTELELIPHYRLMREFFQDPSGFLDAFLD
ncbi:ATP-binding protein [Phreatobacter aquaticus]|uniref:ATP-binding protein n=1 Tax=Phreatobacter aquaticus TaxID=2570229 RepID=A0A4D7QRU8_9HYPH|nr:AAA family ATPase [Phreatobacter aquaticus]QCK86822.1 ATP-binding protein [Phreatobacter aquaticus]